MGQRHSNVFMTTDNFLSVSTPQAFTGSGNRLDGKTKGIEPSPAPLTASDIKRLKDVLYFIHVEIRGA